MTPGRYVSRRDSRASQRWSRAASRRQTSVGMGTGVATPDGTQRILDSSVSVWHNATSHGEARCVTNRRPPAGRLSSAGGYYVLDRLADATEVVTLVSAAGDLAVVRGRSGAELVVAAARLSPVPAAEFYRELRGSPGAR